MFMVENQEQLEALADGTIITWLRIPGDDTSAAVAFVHHQDEANNDIDGRVMEPSFVRTVWVSPGGWAPQSPESAGVNYPAAVIWMGGGHSPFELARAGMVSSTNDDLVADAMAIDVPGTLMVGGTYPRDEALRAAARLAAGNAVNSRDWVGADSVLVDAEKFEKWLSHEADGSHPPYVTASDLDLILEDVRDEFSDGSVMYGTVLRIVDTVARTIIKHVGVPK